MDIQVLTQYFLQYGAVFIFVIILLEYMNLPGFPAGIIMPLAGIWAARDKSVFHGNGPGPGGRASGKLDFIRHRPDGREPVSGPLSGTFPQT